MYKANWDLETGGILLQSVAEDDGFTNLRPVFYEELDMLGLASSWKYSQCEAPLLWSDSAHNYYYAGEKVAKVKAQGYYHKPEVIFLQNGLELRPVNLEKMAQRNAPFLDALAQESIAFIHKTYVRYKKSVDAVVAAFSGGKDSLVLMDLMRRTLSPHNFFAIFNDTDMELDVTYDAVAMAATHWDDVTIHTTRSRFKAEESWSLFGPPSRLHRWCCSVHKSVPTQLYLRDLIGRNGVKILLFDGVRNDESHQRGTYDRITKGAKNAHQYNASPLLAWNETEIFLYLLSQNIFFNRAYRYGVSRVGCVLCPTASKWWDSLLFTTFQHDAQILPPIIDEYAKLVGKETEAERQEYIAERAWCGRAGGRGLAHVRVHIDISAPDTWDVTITQKNFPIALWLSTLGRLEILSEQHFRVMHKNFIFSILEQQKDKKHRFRVSIEFNNDKKLSKKLRNIFNKLAYCVSCGACDAICSTGALDTLQKKLNYSKCIHCEKCTEITEKGCFAAKSLWISSGGEIVKGINRYNHFGMKTDWVESFFQHLDTWTHEHTLGSLQFKAMKTWLKEAELFMNEKPSEYAYLLSQRHITDSFIWEYMWVNLAQNSALISWYLSEIQWGETLTKSELVQRAGESLSETSRSNAMLSLLSLLENTPLGNLGLGEISGSKARRVLYKKGQQRHAHADTLLYILAKRAEATKIYNFSLTHVHEDNIWSPTKLFGVPLHESKATLAQLANTYPDLLRVEFVKDLDNVFLNEHITSLEVVRRVAKQ